jgi:TPR repeat protein
MLLVLAGGNRSDAASPLPHVRSEVKKQVAFACAHETARIPPRDPEADQLYKHARWLVKANVLKQDPAAYPPIERLVRIATARGHDRANIELRGMRDKDQAHSADPVNEAIDLVQDLIKRGIPAGYYDMRWYVEHGYGVDADQELAFKYYRKAADPGNPEGQCLVGNLLNDRSKHGPEIAAIGLAMQRCAADQGHAKAANEYATDVRLDGISRRP